MTLGRLPVNKLEDTTTLTETYDGLVAEFRTLPELTAKTPQAFKEKRRLVGLLAELAEKRGYPMDQICSIIAHDLKGVVSADIIRSVLPAKYKNQLMILVGTAPRGGEDIMHLEKPSLARYIGNPQFSGYALLQKIFFAPTESSQKAGADFVARLAQRKEDQEPAAGGEVMEAQIMAFREWEQFEGDRFANLKGIRTPALVVNGIYDEMIPVRNSYWLGENLPNAVLLTYPDSGHGSFFQFHESFTRHAAAFLNSGFQSAAY